jgi:hypothetical protein
LGFKLASQGTRAKPSHNVIDVENCGINGFDENIKKSYYIFLIFIFRKKLYMYV